MNFLNELHSYGTCIKKPIKCSIFLLVRSFLRENIIFLFISLLSLPFFISFHLPLHFINIRYKDSNINISLIIFCVVITQLFTIRYQDGFTLEVFSNPKLKVTLSLQAYLYLILIKSQKLYYR